MLKLLVTPRDGAETAIDGKAGYSVMELLRDRFPDDILALCGGSCSCATCHVYVDESFIQKLPPQGQIENDLLEMCGGRRRTSRLSCQIPFEEALDGLKLTIAPEE